MLDEVNVISNGYSITTTWEDYQSMVSDNNEADFYSICVQFPEICTATAYNPPPNPVNTIQTWYLDYDGDGYHGSTYQAVDSPGDKWKTTTNGVDCDDARSQYTTVCCTTTCDSGYKLNVDNCECVLLPPCFGSSTSSYNTSQNSPLTDQLSSILNGLGIAGDAKMAVIKLASGNLDDIASYLANLEMLSKGIAVGSVFISIENFRNQPTTENLLQVLFDSGLAAVAFLPAAVAPWAPFVSFAGSFANASGATSYVLGNLADLIDRSVECNVGLGLRHIFQP